MKRLTSLDNITTPESWKKKVLDTASLGAPKLKKKYEFATVALAASLAIAFIGINVFSHKGEINYDDTAAQVEDISSAAEKNKNSNKDNKFKDPTESRADTYDELCQKVQAHTNYTTYTYHNVNSGVIVKITEGDGRKTVYLMTKEYGFSNVSSSALKEINVIRKFRITSDTLCYPWKGDKDPADYKKVELHPEGETPYEVALGNVDEFQFKVGDAVQIYSDGNNGFEEKDISTALKCFELSETIANSGEYISKDTKDALKAARAIDRTGKVTSFETVVWSYACNVGVKCPELILSDDTAKDMRVKKLTTIPMGSGEVMYSVLWVRPDRDDDMTDAYTYNEVYAKDDHIASVDIMVKDRKICTVTATADTIMPDPDDPEACEHASNVIDYMYATPDPDDSSAFYVIIVTTNNGNVEHSDNIAYFPIMKSDVQNMKESYIVTVDPDADPGELDLSTMFNNIYNDNNTGSDPTLFDPTVNLVVSYSDWKKAKDENRNAYRNAELIIAEPQEFKALMDQKGIEYDTDFDDEDIDSIQIEAFELERLYSMNDKSEGYGPITEKLHVDISFDD